MINALAPARRLAWLLALALPTSLMMSTAAAETSTTSASSAANTSSVKDDNNLRPFKSDGCSAFPNGTSDHQHLWLACCQLHDYAYWKGGTQEERMASDLALKQCVAAVGEPHIAELMLTGVRVGGTPYLPTSFRWGYGWPFLRGYKPLSEEEKQQVRILNQAIEW